MKYSGRSHVNNTERQVALGCLLAKANSLNELPHGAISAISQDRGIHRNTLSTIWERYKKGEEITNRRSVGGFKKGYKNKNIIQNKLHKLQPHQKGTIIYLQKHLQISTGSIKRALDKG